MKTITQAMDEAMDAVQEDYGKEWYEVFESALFDKVIDIAAEALGIDRLELVYADEYEEYVNKMGDEL